MMSSEVILECLLNRCLPSDEHLSDPQNLPGTDHLPRFLTYGWALLEYKSDPGSFEQLFMSLKTNQDRVALILCDLNLLPPLNKLVALMMSSGEKRAKSKCSQKGLTSRREGSASLERNDLKSALFMLNEAIVWTPDTPTSQDMAICFAKRSAVLFALSRFKDCLLDIEEALNRNHPKDKTPILLLRKVRCLRFLGEDEDAHKVVQKSLHWLEHNVKDEYLRHKLTSEMLDIEAEVKPIHSQPEIHVSLKEPNHLLFGANRSIRMGYNPEKGRTIEATRDIGEGEILVIERPFASWLDPSYYSDYCHHCLKPLRERVIPCTRCPSVRFCTALCFEESWQQYHRIECPHLETLKLLQIKFQMSLRMAVIYGIKEIAKAGKEPTVPYSEWPKEFMRHDLRSLSSLYLGDNRDFLTIYGFAFGAAIITHLAEKLSIVRKALKPILGGFLMKLLFQLHSNTYTIDDDGLKCSQYEDIFIHDPRPKGIGCGLYSTASMFSHKCFCNTQRFFIGSQIVVTSTQSIKCGEEVTVTYRGDCVNLSLEDRQRYFQEKFNFTCCCASCLNREEPSRYKCPLCGGNWVENEDETNYCVKCGERNQKMANVLSAHSLGRDHLKRGLEALNKPLLNEAEAHLRECEAIFSLILSDDNYSHVYVKRPLSRCFEAKNMFDKALKSLRESTSYEMRHWGEHSLNLFGHFLKIVELCLKKGTANGETCSLEAKQQFEACSAIFTKFLSMEFKAASQEQIKLISKYNALKGTLGASECPPD